MKRSLKPKRTPAAIIALSQLNYGLTQLNLEYLHRWLPEYLSTVTEPRFAASGATCRPQALTAAERMLAAQTPVALFDAAYAKWGGSRPQHDWPGDEPAHYGFVLNAGALIWHIVRWEPHWTGMAFGLDAEAQAQWRAIPYDRLPALARLYCPKFKARWWPSGGYWDSLTASVRSVEPDRLRGFWRFSLQRQAAEMLEMAGHRGGPRG